MEVIKYCYIDVKNKKKKNLKIYIDKFNPSEEIKIF